MKKFIFGLIATVMFGFVGKAQVNTGEVKIPLSDKTISNSSLGKIKIHLEIGRPRHDCLGLWICKGTVDIEIAVLEGIAKTNQAVIEFDYRNKKATLFIQNIDGNVFEGNGEDSLSFEKYGVVLAKNYSILSKTVKIDGVSYNYSVEMDLK
jgi:hypothetical protein